ncbi:CBS domain-containing protein [Sulfitobacter sabulilitoris]|uniref:CBS domain-containing protein n=1 Tax=Sulfitobacter sabulilitoris TaxID=2562655 RepID=A0A5S3PM91_9RHOB|nr:CBS domain-containing protein [Sulfitobacter sabulilitoris]TMM55528.1 CBS domain-containing protein [Sulfitobacter sabulilitoris]
MRAKTLQDLIGNGPVHVTEQQESIRSACTAMSAANIGALPVVEGKQLVGILSERDVIRRCVIVNRLPEDTTVKQVMTPNPQWLPADARPAEALEVMIKGRFRHLPVCEGGRIVGVVSLRDIPKDTINPIERFFRGARRRATV